MCAERAREEVTSEEEFDFADWLAEGIRGIRRGVKRKPRKLVPETFCEHVRASQKEMLLAFRSLLDAAIEHLEPAEVTSPRRRRTTKKVEVQ